MPGFYRLDQCDEDGAPIDDAPPAYVSIESTRNAAPIGEADPRDAIIRDLAQINADVTRTIAERFGNVMQAAADILRAADGAGLSRRQPPPAPAPAPPPDDDEDEDEEDESEPAPDPFGPLKPLVEMAMPHLPTLGAFLWGKLQELMKQNATAPAASSPAASASAPAPTAASSAAPAPGDVAAGPSAPAPAVAPGPVASSSAPVPAAASDAVPAPATAPSPEPVPAPAASTTAPAAPTPAAPTPAAPTPTTAASSPPPTAVSGSSTLEGAAPSTTANTVATPTTPAGIAMAAGPRNAPPAIEPTPEQWAHLFAIRSRLSPREVAIADTVVTRMTPEMRAEWLAELSVLTVDRAVEVVRSMILKALPKPPSPRRAPPLSIPMSAGRAGSASRNDEPDMNAEGEGCLASQRSRDDAR